MKQLLAELFERHYKDIYAYLFSLCHDASLSEDLAAELYSFDKKRTMASRS